MSSRQFRKHIFGKVPGWHGAATRRCAVRHGGLDKTNHMIVMRSDGSTMDDSTWIKTEKTEGKKVLISAY